MSKLIIVALALLAIPVQIASCTVIFYALNMYNPEQLGFLASFEVANDSGSGVLITPIGMAQGSGLYMPLPRYKDAFPPAVPMLGARHNIPVGAGQTVRITYDWDDINFRHILVKTGDGRILILDTDKMGGRDGCYDPQQSSYRIPPLAELPLASSELAPCAEKGRAVVYSGAVEYP